MPVYGLARWLGQWLRLYSLCRVGRRNQSTCSHQSFLRGAGQVTSFTHLPTSLGLLQKVIGFSFYDSPNSTKAKERKYFEVGWQKTT